MTDAPDWIAVDWGSSNLRAWAMGADGTVRGEASSPAGAITLAPDAFEPALLEAVGGWLGDGPTDVIVCGMAGARGGWVEAAYATVPCPPTPASFARPPVSDRRLAVRILPGLRQDEPADVMRGEETQLAGLLRAEPGFDGVACLPGTHTKWCHVGGGEVVSFASYMTGEIFALLAGSSVLRKTLATEGWSDEAFLDRGRGGPLAARAGAGAALPASGRRRCCTTSTRWSRARASRAYLIGAELASARAYWLGREVVLIGADRLVAAYREALSLAGLTARAADAAESHPGGARRRS